MAVVREVLLVFAPCVPPDVSGGRERERCQAIAVDRHLFLYAIPECPDIEQLVEPVITCKILVLIVDFLVINESLLFRVLDAEILAPFIQGTVRELPRATELERTDRERDEFMCADCKHRKAGVGRGSEYIKEPVLDILYVI